MDNKLYTKAILWDLYLRAMEYQKQRKQWIDMGSYDLASEYQIKLETLVELMENIYCFNVGGGANQDFNGRLGRGALDKRLDSFKKVVKV